MLKTILLGIIQGLTEFLPVSSSGHLVLSQHFLNHGETSGDLSLEVFLHFGSLMAVLIYFRKDIIPLFISLFKWDKGEETKNHHNQIYYILTATFITGIIGIVFKDFIESLFNNALLVSIFLSVTGVIIFFSDKLKSGNFKSGEIGFLKSVFIGLGQAFAITPGISRSGSTIAFSLFTGMKREEAAKFSFILSIPAILGANMMEFKSLTTLNTAEMINYFAGFVAAFVSGYLVIGVLLKMIQKAQLKYFAIYCWIISLVSITLLILGF
ncbi:MAG TPA: undecaprenyl-diphosphate phosphatase [Candidatus Cloacimonadota bacterium]|nr:undecaprenyl-diphosphate phosphatase [Candidatus Cloacimonadota bacterium]